MHGSTFGKKVNLQYCRQYHTYKALTRENVFFLSEYGLKTTYYKAIQV